MLSGMSWGGGAGRWNAVPASTTAIIVSGTQAWPCRPPAMPRRRPGWCWCAPSRLAARAPARGGANPVGGADAHRRPVDSGSPTDSTLTLDLASQASICDATDRLRAEHDRIDRPAHQQRRHPRIHRRPCHRARVRGTFATNHLGCLGSRVWFGTGCCPCPVPGWVTLSSLAHRPGALYVDDLQSEGRYHRDNVYGRPTRANLMFTEFHRDVSPALRVLYGPACGR